MDRDDLDYLAGNPNHIPGIYNYCDRWCERCPMTSRCLNFQMEELENERDPASRDPENEAFWNRISENFKVAEEMLHEMAEQEDIDFDEIDQEEMAAYQRERERMEEANRAHPISVHAMRYLQVADQWMDASKDTLQRAGKEVPEKAVTPSAGVEADLGVVNLNDAIEVIRWYQHFIYVKMMRALGGRLHGDALAEKYDFPKDSDGSAKIALIAIDRSIGAWTWLRKKLSDPSDEILDILVFLNRLRKLIENEFPHGRSFQRPGFDYIPEPGEE